MDTSVTVMVDGESNSSSGISSSSYVLPPSPTTNNKTNNSAPAKMREFQVKKVEDPLEDKLQQCCGKNKQEDEDDHIDLDIKVDFDEEDEENLEEFYACGSPKPAFCTPPPVLDPGEVLLSSGSCGYFDFSPKGFGVEGYIGDDGYLYEKALYEHNLNSANCGGLDAFAIPLAFQRVNSSQILYEKKKKKPKLVAQYLIGDLIGEGSYSKVKEVLDTVTLERRAVKIMKKKRLRKIPNGEENVEREIKCLRRLNHENLIKLYDVIVDKEKAKICIFMDYCVGALQEVIDAAPQHKLPIHQAHGYFIQLINGLEYLHSQGIIHKDIKPGNLLITMDNVIKIIDLGVSEMLDRFRDDMISMSQGTTAFQPPEIADGLGLFSGFKVDIWAAGVTLYNMTTGRLPFEAETVYRLLDRISACQLTIPDFLGRMLVDLLNGMLRRQFCERMSIDQIKHHDWFISKHPIDAPAVKVPLRAAIDDLDENELLGGGRANEEQRWRSSSVLPYLCQLQQIKNRASRGGDNTPSGEEEGFDDDEEFVAYSSNGSIARLNELTIQSCRSNASKASKTSQRSFASLFSNLKKTKQVARSTLGLDVFASNANVLGGCFGLGKRH